MLILILILIVGFYFGLQTLNYSSLEGVDGGGIGKRSLYVGKLFYLLYVIYAVILGRQHF